VRYAQWSRTNKYSGGETVTLDTYKEGVTFMVYVEISDKAQRDQFKESGALVTLWYYKGGIRQIEKAQLDASKYNGERFWFVGCVGKGNPDRDLDATGAGGALGGGLFTNGFQNFFEDHPTSELEDGYCSRNLLGVDVAVAGKKPYVGDWTMTITVMDAVEKNTPVALAKVTAKTWGYEVQGTTNKDGEVVLDVTVAGMYTITAEREDFVTGSLSAFVENSKVSNTKVILELQWD